MCVGRRIINCFQCTHACLYALIYPKPGSALCKIYTYIHILCMCICLIRAFKNNTITVVVFAGCVCVCVLYLKHAQQLKVFFTQIEFAPRTLPPSTFPSVAVAAVAASVAADVAVAVIIAAFGIANFAASHRSLPLTTWKICCHCHVTHKIQHKKKI